ncbi:hypothetical protein PL8927_750157 [Planktothrix serta PCC 8927]|uniref:Transposase putative helix-turn-helix domain-containing protein n=1 Tax=Planktothrix serta PCC 8927 TaxID=671068 RepID=A0A7Z9BU23_9CYAN|nr:helix-turn-helix domain-containing protein [Planktothrix serta]VXD22564.1 hypothetical protein PL8927_750157 [Planktothrix serta PCC 8927]
MLDVLRVRIYPNQEQQAALAKNFGCCRMVWNYYLIYSKLLIYIARKLK